ncbi:MAG: hypothetical protein CM1200mP15_08590 [Dehalococcoidia bacterium]|nr:MAG: hypothetical protein CM1200mP15_08590 [Dehalococcoidia bacterium]
MWQVHTGGSETAPRKIALIVSRVEAETIDNTIDAFHSG